MTTFWSVVTGVSVTVVIVAGLSYLAYLLLKPEQDEKSKETKTPAQQENQDKKKWNWSWVMHPAFFIAVGVAMINWLMWALNGDFWNSLWNNQSTFWALNVTGWVAPSLLLIKGAGDKTHPIAKTFSKIMGVLAILILGLGVWKFNDKWTPSFGSNTARTPTYGRQAHGQYMFGPENVPAEVALRVIGSCESTGQPNNEPVHYEKGSTTELLKNKEGSSARGKYQFMPSHWVDAKKIGFDLNKEAEYHAYAVDHYNRTGTKHWEFDAHRGQGPACWGETLARLSQGRGYSTFAYARNFLAPIDDFGDPMDVIGYRFSWGKSEGIFIVKNESGVEARFNPKENLLEDLPRLPKGFSRNLRFKSLSNKPEKVTLELTKY